MTLPIRRSGSSPLTRWDPFREFEDLYQRMGQLFEASVGGRAGDGGTLHWSPLADLTESDDAYLIEVDLPGVKRDDITIELAADEIAITGEFKEKERTGLLRSHTRHTGGFEYRSSLPRDVDTENITADLADGVLSVRIPKTAAAKPRRIAITGG